MILKNIKVECVDARTGLVLKRITTTEWEHMNRKLAVNNSLANCEYARLKFGKSLINSPFQIYHIRHDNKDDKWIFEGIEEGKRHANKQNRFFLAFQQRSMNAWRKLTWSESENDFQDLATRGLSLIPYSIPMKGRLDDWETRKSEAESILNKSQKLVPIFCSNHQIEYFNDLFGYEFGKSQLIGIQCYSINNANTVSNLATVKIKNMSLKEGMECPLLLGLNYTKMLKSISNVAGSFLYSCFGMDILSDRQIFLENMPPDVCEKILKKTPEEIYRYDRSEGGFNFSDEQVFWTGINMTREFLEKVSVNEGLTAYQAIQWGNYFPLMSKIIE